MKPSLLIDRLLGASGRFVDLETMEGLHREGKLTGWTMRQFKINGQDVDWPEELELNGDPNDRIPLDRIASINIQR